MNLILATALVDDHRRDLMLDAEDARLVRLARSPIVKSSKPRSWMRRLFPASHHEHPRRIIGYRDWLTAGRL